MVIGASSGGIEPLIEIAGGLPPDLGAAIFIVVHVPARGKSLLPEILERAGRLPAAHAKDGESIQAGRIYVAPPDFHLTLSDGRTHIARGPKENNHRPAIDPLFRSAAQTYGPRAVGIVLSGALDDGAAGLFAIKNRGGVAIVQDPQDALFPDMPQAALAAVPVDYCVPKKDIARLVAGLAQMPVVGSTIPGATVNDREEIKKETALAEFAADTNDGDERPGSPSVYGCPDCDGTLWELQDDQWLRFRCRVGHAYSAEGLLGAQAESLDSALWSAFRSLQESAALAGRMAERARNSNHLLAVDKFEKKAQRAAEQAALIRNLLLNSAGKNESAAELKIRQDHFHGAAVRQDRRKHET